MSLLATDLSLAIVSPGGGGDNESSLMDLYQPGCPSRFLRHALMGLADGEFVFDGQRIDGFAMCLNTLIATGSEVLALLARIHGQCEIHGYLEEGNRRWLSGIIQRGLEAKILRESQGWDEVSSLLRSIETHPGPVVMSYSVTDGFPSLPNGVIEDVYLRFGCSRYGDLPPEGQRLIDAAEVLWDSLDSGTKWEKAMDALRRNGGGLEIAPDNLTTQRFSPGPSIWDAVASNDFSGAAYARRSVTSG